MSDKEATEAKQALEGYTSALIGVGEAVTIVRDLASREPIVTDHSDMYPGEVCGVCGGRDDTTRGSVDHAESCPWRRAVEWVEHHPTEGA